MAALLAAVDVVKNEPCPGCSFTNNAAATPIQ
jgi:hypothetical protein